MAEPEPRLLMLIDDEPAQSRLITALASREGWRTVVVKDSETAIATLGTREGMQLSAIILDQWVPGDDACNLIAELKSRRPALPILMLTTRSDRLSREAGRARPADAGVEKRNHPRGAQGRAPAADRKDAGDARFRFDDRHLHCYGRSPYCTGCW